MTSTQLDDQPPKYSEEMAVEKIDAAASLPRHNFYHSNTVPRQATKQKVQNYRRSSNEECSTV